MPVGDLFKSKSPSHSPALTKGQKHFERGENGMERPQADKINFNRVLGKLVGQPHSTIILEVEKFLIDYEFFGEGIIGKIALSPSARYNMSQAISELKAISPLMGLIVDLRKHREPESVSVNKEDILLINDSSKTNSEGRKIDLTTEYSGPIVVLHPGVELQIACYKSVARSLRWKGMTSQLIENCSLRRKTDADLNHFYQNLEDPQVSQKVKNLGCGPQDLPLKEATNIIKDMIFLSNLQ